MSTTSLRRGFGSGFIGIITVLATLFSGLVAMPANAAPTVPGSAERGFQAPNDQGRVVSGLIMDGDGNAMANVYVTLLDGNEQTNGAAMTGDDGLFSITATAAGDYKLSFEDSDMNVKYFDNADTFADAELISVTDDTGVYIETHFGGINPPAGTSTVTGAVVDQDGEPVQGVTVDLLTVDGDIVASVESDSNGSFVFSNQAAGTYTVCYSKTGFVSSCYGGSANEWNAETFDLNDNSSHSLMPSTLVEAGGVSGTVWPNHASDTGLSGVRVSAYTRETWGWAFVDATTADADGNYELATLEEGTYRIVADPESSDSSEYQPQWWPNATIADNAQSINVTPGTVWGGLDFSLDLGGSIEVSSFCLEVGLLCMSGTATLEALDLTLPTSERTVEGAEATFDGLPDGRYLVRFVREGDSDFYWGGDGSRETAEVITIEGGSTVSGIFYVYGQSPLPSYIEGTVDLDGGSPITVYVIGEGQEIWETTRIVDSVETTENGYFDFMLSPGRYTLQFGEDSYTDDAGNEYLGHASYWSGAYRLNRATWIDLAADETESLGNITLPTRSVTINGTIRNNATSPVAQANVTVTLESVNGSVTTTTASNGSYTVTGLAPGLYSMTMEKPGFAPTFAQSVQSRPSVNAPNASGTHTLNGTIAIANSSIRGRITAAGTGISDGSVLVIARRGSDTCPAATSEIDENGNYELTGLVAGTYTVTAATTFVYSCAQDYNGNSSAESNWQNQSRSITVTATGATSNLTGQNFAMVAGGIIRGQVDGFFGNAAIGVYGTNNEFVAYADVSTDGTYEVLGLVPGSYYVQLWETPTSAPQWWTASTSTRAIVNVTAGSAVTDVSFDAEVGGTITGRVTTPDGKPVTGELQAFDRFGIEVGYYNFADQNVGAYTVYSLPEGPIRLRLTVGGVDHWIGGGTSLANAHVMYVSNGGVSTAPTLSLANLATVSGEVTVGGFAERGSVTLIDSTGRETATAQVENGRYSFPNVVPGLYTVRFISLSKEFVWYGNRDTLASATYVNVTPGAIMENIDLNAVPATAAFVPGAVSVTGTNRVGQTMTVAPGTWSPAPTAIQYRWLTDWSAAPVSTAATYVVKPEDQGKFLRLQVIISKSGVASDFLNIDLGRVMGLAFTTAPVPTITPATAPRIGTVLTAAPGTWSPAATVSYQWYRGNTPIQGATASTYTVALDDLGARISVRTVGTRAGYLGLGRSSTQLPAAILNTLTASPTPTVTVTSAVTGTRRPGDTLTAVPGSWTPAPVGLNYQWRRGSTAIPGATNPTYVLTSEDVGASITVAVTGGKVGFTSITRTSAAVTGITALSTRLTGATPTISGTLEVGQTLTATAGTWTSGTSLAYQWFRNGAAIRNATGSTYVLTPADYGKVIRVSVTGTKDTFSPLRKQSASTNEVDLGVINMDDVQSVLISGSFLEGGTLTANSIGWPVSVKLTYQWLRDGLEIPGATKRSYTTSSRDRDRYIKVRVTAQSKGYESVTLVSEDGGYTVVP